MLASEPAETHETDLSLHKWLCATVNGYDPVKPQPIQATCNGLIIPCCQWPTIESGVVELRVKQQGGSLGGVLNFIFPVFALANIAFTGGLGVAAGSSLSSTRGESLESATTKANIAKLNQPIPDGAGRLRRYPNYLTPPHRYFENKTEQWVEFLACVGVGKYQINSGDVLIGDSKLIALGDAAEFTIHNPGADLTGISAADWWHSAPEVGATSDGKAGLKLDATSNIQVNPNASSYLFDVDDIEIPSGAGEYPAGWSGGLKVRVEQYRDYEVDGATILGEPLAQLEPFVGMVIEIVGDNEGLYKVSAYIPYSAAIPPDAGSASALTADSVPARFDFDVTPASFDVLLDGNTYPVSLSANVTDLAGLVVAINSDLGAAPIVASDFGGKVRLTEQSPFSGMPITLSGSTVDIFGASPVGITGSETTAGTVEVQAEISLTYDDGSPVSGLLQGARRMAIGYRGLLYQTTSGSTSSISVERLTDAGAVDGGWGGFSTITTNDAVLTLDASNVEGGWIGPFAACPAGEKTKKLEVDFFFPSGLIFTGNKELYAVTVKAEVQYRDIALGGAWTSQIFTYTDLNPNQFAFTETIDLGSLAYRPEVQVRRIGADSNSTRTSDDIQWYGLRSQLTPPASYEGVTTIAVKIRASDRLAAQSENKLSCIATRVLPTRSGGLWTIETPTRSIAAYAAYIAKSIGYTDEQIDLAEFDALETIWSSRGDYYDWTHDEGTVSKAIEQVLQAGFAKLTIERGTIRPVRDSARTVYEQMYTPQNMVQTLQRALEAVRPDDADGVDVEYVDAETWTSNVVECRLAGDMGIKTEKLKLDGVTNRTKAWRIGMRRRREIKYRRWAYSFSTELDAMNSRYLSYVALADDVPGYGKSSILEDLVETDDGHVLTVSEHMDWAGSDHIVAIRNPDGTLNGPYPATQGEGDFKIVADLIDAPVISFNQEPPHVLFGPIDRWVFPALISSIKPSGAESVSVQAVNYDVRVYADDDNSPT